MGGCGLIEYEWGTFFNSLRCSPNSLKDSFLTPWLKPVFPNIRGFKKNLENLLKYGFLAPPIKTSNARGLKGASGICRLAAPPPPSRGWVRGMDSDASDSRTVVRGHLSASFWVVLSSLRAQSWLLKQWKRQKLLIWLRGTLVPSEPVYSSYILLQPERRVLPIASPHQKSLSCTEPCLTYGQLSKLKPIGHVSGRE